MTLRDAARRISHSLRLDAPTFNLSGPVDWPQLLHHADSHSLTPLLYTVWREADVLNQIPADARARLEKAFVDNGLRNTHIRAEVVDIHQRLLQANCSPIVLKGWPLVERLYADSAQRVLYDHDFLVPADQAEMGHRALREGGFQPLPAQDAWVEKHLPPLWRNDGYHWDGYLFDPHYPRPVELHLRLWEHHWRGLSVRSLPDVWQHAQTRVVAGVPMRVLSDEDTLVHLAMHFAGHLIEREARLNQLLDLARFVQRTSLNWERCLAQAQVAGVGRFVYAALFLAQAVFGAPLPPASIWQAWAARTPPHFRAWLAAQGAIDVLTSTYRQRDKGQDYHLTFLAARSLSERVGIVRFALLPPVGQLMAKYKVRSRWLGALLYPRHLAERLSVYGRALLSKS